MATLIRVYQRFAGRRYHASVNTNTLLNQDLSSKARIELLAGKTVAVLGYGAQGHAHALNLRDSGVSVIVVQRPNSARHRAAVADGFTPVSISDATKRADLLIFSLPDEAAPQLYRGEIAPHLRDGQALGFIHGYNIHFKEIVAPPGIDVVLVAPKAQGRGVRSEFLAGRGVFALVAVHQDATGRALDTALGWAAGLGSHRAAILPTTFRDETETDLFGEQTVLCGGVSALIKMAFETLVDAGYPPEVAYFECCHELKLVVDLIHERGISGMRELISNTARYGDVTRGPRVIGPAVRTAMKQVLTEIQSGEFAREWRAETAAGKPVFNRLSAEDRKHPIEQIGREIREHRQRSASE